MDVLGFDRGAAGGDCAEANADTSPGACADEGWSKNGLSVYLGVAPDRRNRGHGLREVPQ